MYSNKTCYELHDAFAFYDKTKETLPKKLLVWRNSSCKEKFSNLVKSIQTIEQKPIKPATVLPIHEKNLESLLSSLFQYRATYELFEQIT